VDLFELKIISKSDQQEGDQEDKCDFTIKYANIQSIKNIELYKFV